MVGKWHLGYKPELHAAEARLRRVLRLPRRRARRICSRQPDARSPILRGDKPVDEKEYLTDAFAREAVAFIEQHKDEPFFLYLPFNAVHAPLQATGEVPGALREHRGREAPDVRGDARRRWTTPSARCSTTLARLKPGGEHADLLPQRQRRPDASTTSSATTRCAASRADVLEGGIRVPFMVQWKGKLPAGKVYDQPVIPLDILPTAVAAAGAQRAADAKLDGVNLLPFLTGKSTAAARTRRSTGGSARSTRSARATGS